MTTSYNNRISPITSYNNRISPITSYNNRSITYSNIYLLCDKYGVLITDKYGNNISVNGPYYESDTSYNLRNPI